MTKIEFDRKKHRYYIDGEFYPSVTQILSLIDKSQPLMQWAVNVALDYIKQNKEELHSKSSGQILYAAKKRHKELKKEAGDLGSQIHKLIERYLKNWSYEEFLTERISKQFESFKNWVQENNFSLVNSEKFLFNKKYQVAGTTDIVAYLGNKLYLIDLKTSKGIYEEMILQLAIYRYMWENLYKTKIDGMGILRLDKETGDFEFKEYNNEEYKKAVKMFLLLSKYWHLKNQK